MVCNMRFIFYKSEFQHIQPMEDLEMGIEDGLIVSKWAVLYYLNLFVYLIDWTLCARLRHLSSAMQLLSTFYFRDYA